MVGGAYLVAVWAVGIVLMAGGLLFGLDALLREDTSRPRQGLTSHEQILERWKRAS
jgi:hypothetical protein